MDKFNFETKDGIENNVEKIAEIFPSAVTEGKVNFDTLRTLLGDEVAGDERYEFTWVGKKEAMREAGKPIRKTLRPCPEESKNWEETENLYIEGDNLEVLKLLQESYLGKIKMIYIDPPYNTGNDFIYADDYSIRAVEYQEESGVLSEDGDRLFKNTDTNGRYHSDWCSMMYPRLVLARNLLSEDGVIFISIDENEAENIKKIADEVFGHENYRNQLLVRRRIKSLNLQFADNGLNSFNIAYEYVFVYSKTREFLFNPIRGEKKNSPLTGKWNVFWSNADRPTMRYDILGFAPKTGQWRWQQALADEAVKNYIEYENNFSSKMSLEEYNQMTGNSLRFIRRIPGGKGKNGGVQYWVAPSDTSLRTSNWTDLEVSQIAKDFDLPFDNPKNVSLIQTIISSVPGNNFTVLDFFSGSSTTADAVMRSNQLDNGSRKFIMIQLPEKTDKKSEAYKSGYRNIADIGKERIRRAGEMVKAEIREENKQVKLGEESKPIPDIGFRVFKVDESNMKDVYYSAEEYKQIELDQLVSNIKEDRTDMDLLFACLLDWGLPLSMPHYKEEIDGVTVHTYNNGDLIACFADNISEQLVRTIASRQPLRAVFRDSSFANSPSKINVEEIFKLLAPNTSIRVL